MRDQAIVCNIGHFDNEIQVNALNEDSAVTRKLLNHKQIVIHSRMGIRYFY